MQPVQSKCRPTGSRLLYYGGSGELPPTDCASVRLMALEPDPPGPSGRQTGGRWLAPLAFGVVAVPFAIAIGRLLFASGNHLTLPDDLALIDLHTREALHWHQQLGVFDRNGWDHPGPAYFYWLSLFYRVFGSGTRAMFIAAATLNAVAAIACISIVRRRVGALGAMWTAFGVGVLCLVLAQTGPTSTTYSEGVLGGLVSPWNPMVVILPLLACLLLCAGALDRSWRSLVGAVLVGSFIVQTDLSTLPLVAMLLLVAAVGSLLTFLRDRRSGSPVRRGRSSWWLGGGGLALLLLGWLPPVVQQLTNHPGNFTLIWRYFNANHPGQSLSRALWATVTSNAVLLFGPREIIRGVLGPPPAHAGLTATFAIAVVSAAAVATTVGVVRRARFGTSVSVLALIGTATALLAMSQVVGPIFGYLGIWISVVPVAALIGLGLVWGAPTAASRTRGRARHRELGPMIVSAGTMLVAIGLAFEVALGPPLAAASDPVVGQVTTLVIPHLDPNGSVDVSVNGFVDRHCVANWVPVEEFIGVVNQLDERGFRPTVSPFWRAQFGPGYVATGHEDRQVFLSQETPNSSHLPGYIGHIGEVVVTVTRGLQAVPPNPCTPR